MERRLSVALAAAGLIAALGFLLLGTGSPDDVRAAAADLDALIRENAAGVQARADTLAQLPRLGWAVATDENTMRDLTTEELAFRTHPGEHIEITQMRKGGGEPRRLLRLPMESEVTLPVLPGTHLTVQGGQLHVVTVVSVEPRQRADELVGILAVAKQVDTSSIEQRLAARGINAALRTIQGSLTLAGSAPPESIEVKIPLTGAAAEGAEIVAANVARPRWPRWLSPLILAASLLAAALLWRRGAPRRPAGSPFAGFPSHAQEAVPASRSTAPTPSVGVDVDADWGHVPSKVTPAMGNTNPELADANTAGTNANQVGAAPQAPFEQTRSGRVDVSLFRSGSVSLAPAAPGAPPAPPDASAAADPRADEYRALFAEFVKLRRTTGESVEGLEVAHFVATLRDKRAQIMKQIPVKDVRFKLAFHNGKAAIRYMTVS